MRKVVIKKMKDEMERGRENEEEMMMKDGGGKI